MADSPWVRRVMRQADIIERAGGYIAIAKRHGFLGFGWGGVPATEHRSAARRRLRALLREKEEK